VETRGSLMSITKEGSDRPLFTAGGPEAGQSTPLPR
jgi:hypothetical protein